jgi:hypothetical protein
LLSFFNSSRRDAGGKKLSTIGDISYNTKWILSKRSTQAIIVITLMTLAFAVPLLTRAFALTDVGNAGVFQLDGTIHKTSSTTFPTNWDALFSSSGTSLSLPPGGLDSGFVNDAPLPDGTTFTTGSKDILDLPNSGWQCTSTNNVTPKDKILDVYSFAIVPSFGSRAGHLLIYGGYERFDNSGAGNVGIWLFQDATVACTSPKGAVNFSGAHQVGDILLTAAFSTGGSVTTLDAFKWIGGSSPLLNLTSSGGNDCTIAPVTANFCARSNSATLTTPWPVQDKTSSPNTLAPAEFFDVGVDLTGLLGPNPPCINRFLFDSRSSPSPTADLHDFALGSLSTCPKAAISTTVSPPVIALGNSATDTATVTLTQSGGTVAGTVDFKVYGPVATNTATCTNLAGSFTGVPIGPGSSPQSATSGSFTPSAPGYYFWTATYNPTTARNGNTVSTSCGDKNESLTVVSSSITTSASNPIALGSTASDTATVTLNPNTQPVAGTVDFTVYGPVATNTPTCTTVAATISGVAINGPGTGATASASFTATAAGYYFWTAKYNPAAAVNGPVATSSCGATGETTTVVNSAITTNVAPSTITFSQSATDTATVTLTPSAQPVMGSVTFTVYGPVATNTPTCTTVAATIANVPISGPGTGATASATFTPKATGYYFWIAVYTPTGPANGPTATTACGDGGETLVVSSIPKITGFGFTNIPTNNDPTLGSGTVTYTWTIHNYGTAAVTLSGTLTVSGTASIGCTGGNTLTLSGSLASGADAVFSMTCMYSGTSGQTVQATISASFTDQNNFTGAVSGSPTSYTFSIQTS